MTPTCPGTRNANTGSASHKPHRLCQLCREISLSSRTSGSWVCCLCLNLQHYRSAAEVKLIKLEPHSYIQKWHCSACFKEAECARKRMLFRQHYERGRKQDLINDRR